MAATLAWGRRGINLNASVWHLNVSRELLLDLRDSHDAKPVPTPEEEGRRDTRAGRTKISSRCDQILDAYKLAIYTSGVTLGFLSGPRRVEAV